MKKPYVKKYKKIGKITYWIVDGNYIRTNIDEDFTNYGHHYKFNFIPENELWIDKERDKGEERFYLDYMLKFIHALKSGKNYHQAVEIGEKVEKKERAKSRLAKKAHKKLKIGESLAKILYKKQLKTSSEIKVHIVNGELVRDEFFIDFTEGGHDKVYHFIPKGEIWIDDDISKEEINFVLLHEIHERNLMAKGWNYEKAHTDSSRLEFFYRNHPKKINKILAKEFKKAKI